jgi:glycerol-3-phosphate dehydrogenase
LENAPTRQDVLSVYAGLRPLAAPTNGDANNTKEISRDHKLIASDSGLITITGGKWTTYRKMAEETVDLAIRSAGLPAKECRTHHLPIHGFTKEKHAGHWQVYGSDFEAIQQLSEQNPELKEKLHDSFEFIAAEVVWACREEMVRKVEDFLARRVRFLLLDAKASLEAAPTVAKIMARELNKPEEWIEKEINDYKNLVDNYLLA